MENKKVELTKFISKVLSEYSDNSDPTGEVYFTFVTNNDRIIANICRENTEVESFILTIEPSDRKFIFKKPNE